MIAELLSYLLYFVVTALVGLVTAAVIYIRWHYGSLEKVKGLPAVVKPSFLGGSDFGAHKLIVHEEDSKNVEKYGKIFGYYEGRSPMIFIADAELIRLIFIKDFDHFQDKTPAELGHELFNEIMDILPYNKWKVVRSAVSPSLTTGRIRNMGDQIEQAIECWLASVKVRLEGGEPFYPKTMFNALACDIISRCAFAFKGNSLDDPNNAFTKHLQSFIFDDIESNFFLSILQLFPFLSKFSPFISQDGIAFFKDIFNAAIKSKKDSKVKANDFLDCLNDMLEKVERGDEEYKKLGITDITVMNQAMLFFIAGFDTIAHTLSMVTYSLATQPQIQAKLLDEVDSYLERHSGQIEHATVGELTYMAAIVQETLRMYSPGIRLDRYCTKDWSHEPTGLHIPRGTTIQVPVHYIHYNEQYYEEAHSFKPERWLPGNKDKLNQYAFLGFGIGNHNCVGMRLAKEVIYLALANILKEMEFRGNDKTKVEYLRGRNFTLGFKPISVDVIKRGK